MCLPYVRVRDPWFQDEDYNGEREFFLRVRYYNSTSTYYTSVYAPNVRLYTSTSRWSGRHMLSNFLPVDRRCSCRRRHTHVLEENPHCFFAIHRGPEPCEKPAPALMRRYVLCTTSSYFCVPFNIASPAKHVLTLRSLSRRNRFFSFHFS